MKKINTIIADDHALFLEGILSLLASEQQITVKGTATDGGEVLDLLAKDPQVEVVVTDISMEGGMSGDRLCRSIQKHHPDTKVLVLTMHKDSNTIAKLLDSGATGYILKNACKEELVQAIHAVANGEVFFGDAVKDNFILAKVKGRAKSIGSHKAELTEREQQVLQLIAEELTTNEIAEKLFISLHTVETHRTNILRKLQARNTAGLIKQAMHQGLIE